MKEMNVTIDSIKSKINIDVIEKRLCRSLHITSKTLYNRINKDEIIRMIATILYHREIRTDEEIDSYFNNYNTAIKSPNTLLNALTCATEINNYIKDDYTIYIYADYDVDGIMAGYIMYDTIKTFTDKVYVIFPEREDGYGLNMNFCKRIVDSNIDKQLVITVDNGISKVDEVKYLKDNNIKVIITDHHQSQDIIPDCLIVDPWNMYNPDINNQHLCGAEVSFKICQLILSLNSIKSAAKYVPYITLALLADVMPLNPENSAIVKYGLDIMNSNNCPESIQLLKMNNKITYMTAENILWSIAPQINACGRMNNTKLAGEFFINPDMDKCSEIILLNEKRKKVTKETLNSITCNDDNEVNIIIGDFITGLLGIIAGKMIDKYNKPAIIASKIDEDIYHGSIRSVDDIDMISLLKDMKDKDIIIEYGGHSGACVCTFDINKINEMNNYFNSNIHREIAESAQIEKKLITDTSINFDYLNETIYALVNLFPCDDRQYQTPMFCIPCVVTNTKLSKNNPNNICFTVNDGVKNKNIWAWGFADMYDKLNRPEKIYLYGNITKDMSGCNYTLKVTDIKERI